jgi:hypothetical protein
MKLQHLAIAASILLATASCNSGSGTTTTDTTAAMSEDTMGMPDTTMSMGMMSGDTSMHMQTCVVMKDNKMMVMKDGKTMDMKEMMTMDNGTKVMPDGHYTTSDGKTMMLKNGDCIMKDGSKTTIDKMPM